MAQRPHASSVNRGQTKT